MAMHHVDVTRLGWCSNARVNVLSIMGASPWQPAFILTSSMLSPRAAFC
jgi:hypothetical protein